MPEQIIRGSGTMRQVGKVLALAAKEHGEVTLRDIAGPDELEREKRAEAWRTIQEQREEKDDKS